MEWEIQKGIVKGAELATPVINVRVMRKGSNGKILEESLSDEKGQWEVRYIETGDTIIFESEGYVKKTFSPDNLPKVVRLLENSLIGYQKRLWFNPGETVDVFVHSPLRFSARLFRHGLQKECILDAGLFDRKIQNVPDDYFVENGLNWESTFSYKIPLKAEPGIYSLLLEADAQDPFAIPMVVSTSRGDCGKRSHLLVLASTNTWQSYNVWGGRSRYRNFEGNTSREYIDLKSPRHKIKTKVAKFLPLEIKSKIKRLLKYWTKSGSFYYKKLTILRPFTNCSLEGDNVYQPFTNHLAAGEWRLLAWLEREGINYDIISGAELHNDPDLLKNYRAIILSTHCEYWTRNMYEGLKYYHENNNLWILNISGNTMYREIAFFEDGSTHCVSLSFPDQSQIFGVSFTEDDLYTCAPYRVLQPHHWAFENISQIRGTDTFGEKSLNRNIPKSDNRYDPGRPGDKIGLRGMGASGWETDKLCKNAPKNVQILAKGTNERGGADMVIREPQDSRGGMFSASSITFGGSLLIDSVASQLVKNIISKALGS